MNLINNMDNEEIHEEVVNNQGNINQDNLIGDLIAALDGIDGAPQDFELEEWKELFGIFYVSYIHDDGDLYIWRTLKRQEYKTLINSGIAKNQIMYEEAVVSRCMLWPKFTKEKIAQEAAGVSETLAKQILYKSGFVPDSMALAMIKAI